MAGAVWEKIGLDEPAARERFAAELARIGDRGARPNLFHDPAWLLDAEDRTSGDVALYACRRDGALIAFAPFVIQPWALRFMVGEITLFSARLQRLHLHGGPVYPGRDLSENELATSLFVLLRRTLTTRQVVYLEGVPHAGSLELALSDERLKRAFRIIRLGAPYERRLILLPDTFEAYLQSLSKHTRQNLRTGQRKLANHIGADPKLLAFTDASQMSEFVARAGTISKKTYQWHLLGLGLRKPEQLERTLTAMALKGWTKCYLLECGSVATAFMIGYQYRGTYYYVDVGFDPDWEAWSVGTLLHIAVLRDLIGSPDRPQWFDFSSGTGPQKERFSNQSQTEANFLLVPKSFRATLLVWSYQAMTTLSGQAVRLLEKLQIKAAVKRLIRRISTRKSTAA